MCMGVTRSSLRFLTCALDTTCVDFCSPVAAAIKDCDIAQGVIRASCSLAVRKESYG